MKSLRITLEGKTYEVGVEIIDGASAAVAPAPVQAAPAVVAAPVYAPAPVAAPAPVVVPPAAAAPVAAGGHPITSPMPGLVMKVRVAVGQHVAKDEEILILEAMKMESPIFAPCAGTVASILIKEGDAVSEGQILIQLS
jgi:glutaconyl-CoA/methylmalonyl-CoA decarboxylase subunit gamma